MSWIIIVVIVIIVLVVIGAAVFFIIKKFINKPILTKKIMLKSAQPGIPLNLAEVEAINSAGENVALKKPVTSSSLFHNEQSYADRLTDGIKSGVWSDNSIAHTSSETNKDDLAWFLIDLGEPVELKEIIVYNRTDCCWDRANGMKIVLYDAEDKIIKEIDTGIWQDTQPVKTFTVK